jgi:1,4-alpha-glucan branching enzyme
MAIKKEYSKDKKVCQVTFTLPKEISENFEEICIVGDFNNWDPHQHKFSHKNADGSCSIEITLEANNEHKFRYLCDRQTWLNELEADKQNPTHYGDSKNSVIVI